MSGDTKVWRGIAVNGPLNRQDAKIAKLGKKKYQTFRQDDDSENIRS